MQYKLCIAMLFGALHFCGCDDADDITTAVASTATEAAACPYSFAKPACADAEPQSPRDLSSNAENGKKEPKAIVLTLAQAEQLPLANVHFHLGAEHKSDEYNDGTDAEAYDAAHDTRRLSDSFLDAVTYDDSRLSERRLAGDVRPGFMCPRDTLTDEQKAPYEFKYCKGDVTVGKSYEVHYVHSSAGYDRDALHNASSMEEADLLADGLGGAANGRGQLNPMIAVQGQVFQIVNGGATYADMLHQWPKTVTQGKMYTGSTTGQSHDNEICSPYAITWHVDLECVQVSPESFDNMCKMMKEEYDMEDDLYPHGSRKIVDAKWVVPHAHVTDLA